MTDAPKTIAEMREAAAELAYDMATAYWDLPEGVDYSGEDLRALSDRIRAIPLPADDAEMVEKVANDEAFLQAIVEHAAAVLHGRYSDAGEYRRVIASAALSAMRGEPTQPNAKMEE